MSDQPTQLSHQVNASLRIGENDSIPLSSIPSNKNSERASSRKNRVYAFHSFLSQTYPDVNSILDVAGGRGDLSFLLCNIDGVDSIIADPREPNFTRIIKSVDFLIQHPIETKKRSIEGLPTYQPLAALIPQLLERHTCMEIGAYRSIELTIPRNVRLHVDDSLVNAIRSATAIHNGSLQLNNDWSSSWGKYWAREFERIASNKSYYGGTMPRKQGAYTSIKTEQIEDSTTVLEACKTLDLIVGFHPDQATEAAIDLAIYLQIPFAVVPCCVFPSEFPERRFDGKKVKSYDEFLSYLLSKHRKIRQDELPFVGSETAKSVVLYMLKEDF